uniref:Fe2OG dioxygenase domain-containing protein n=1 Tax=Leersia perrieri TaxID=77586 RepID=A0A0D9WVY9_9ORYZ
MAAVVFDAAILSKQEAIPSQFVWPADEAPAADAGAVEEIAIPVVDLAGFMASGGGIGRDVAEACERHGFFQVVNHGVGEELLAAAYRCCDEFYARPLAEKERARRRAGENHGYASSFTGRFDCKLPWKETLSFNCPAAVPGNNGGAGAVVDYFVGVLGEDYRHMGEVYQEYCNVMTRLALDITEVLAMALGLARGELRAFFADADPVMRLNHYPPCRQPHLTLGTGPHRDPTSLTLLHQDDVGGLQVLVDGATSWRAVRPRRDAFVVNIGDTFAALTNGRHASCLHRAVVNGVAARRSLTFFLNPRLDRVVAPPPALVGGEEGRPRAFPDFTWREFLEFTQRHYRSDTNTMDAFVAWIKQRDSSGGSNESL